jgi:hypothetical protein
MSPKEINDDFIFQLVDETLNVKKRRKPRRKQGHKKFQEAKEHKKKLAKGFLRGIKIFCDENHIYHSSGAYDESKMLFKIVINDVELEIPANWDKFDHLKDNYKRACLFTMEEDDESLFPQVVSKLMTQKFKRILFFVEDKKCEVVFLNEFHMRRFKSYFDSIEDSSPVMKRAS